MLGLVNGFRKSNSFLKRIFWLTFSRMVDVTYRIAGLSLKDWMPLRRMMHSAGDYPFWANGTTSPVVAFEYVFTGLVQNHGERGSVVNGIYAGDARRLIGCVILLPSCSSEDKAGSKMAASIMYFLDRDFRGRGIMAGAARFVVHEAIENKRLAELSAEIHPENKSSQNIVERLGMSRVEREDLKSYLAREGVAYAQRLYYEGNASALKKAYDHPVRSDMRKHGAEVSFIREPA